MQSPGGLTQLPSKIKSILILQYVEIVCLVRTQPWSYVVRDEFGFILQARGYESSQFFDWSRDPNNVHGSSKEDFKAANASREPRKDPVGQMDPSLWSTHAAHLCVDPLAIFPPILF